MKHIYCFFISIVFLMLSGCGAIKKSVDYDYSLETDIGEFDSLGIDSEQIIQRDFSLVDFQIDTVAWTADITWWTPPDSSGNQYPQKSANINYNKKAINGHRARDSLQCSNQLNIDKTAEKSNENKVTESKQEVTAKKPPRPWWPVVILIFTVCAFVAYKYKMK